MRARAESGELDLSCVVDADEGRLISGLVDVVGCREDGDTQAVVLNAEALLPDLVRAEDSRDCRGAGNRAVSALPRN
jgi:hypothetical protein